MTLTDTSLMLDATFAPITPPTAWFIERPVWLEPGTDIHVDLEREPGRAAGYIASWSQCHLNYPGDCWTPPPSPTSNELFNRRPVETASPSGRIELVRAGTIGAGGTGHSGAGNLMEAQRYHDRVQLQALVGRVEEDEYGPYFLGAAVPTLTVGEALAINRSSLSGEWFWRDTDLAGNIVAGYDLLAPWVVSHPALPNVPMDQRRYGPTGAPIVASAAVLNGHPVMAALDLGCDCDGGCCTNMTEGGRVESPVPTSLLTRSPSHQGDTEMTPEEVAAIADARIAERLKPAQLIPQWTTTGTQGVTITDAQFAQPVAAQIGETTEDPMVERVNELETQLAATVDQVEQLSGVVAEWIVAQLDAEDIPFPANA